MKLRRNEIVAIECSCVADEVTLQPIVLAGGPYAETNRRAMIDNMARIFGGEWSARIVYSWRNRQHLKRFLDRGVKWRGSKQEWA